MKLSNFGEILPAGAKRLILGDPTQQLFPVKYQFCWDYYLAANANHWTPNDIQMGEDRLTYTHKLTDEERWMFDWSLSMLTTQDLVVMGNLEEAIERHLTCPEASMYLARQTDEEAIHTWSYQTVVESLALDPNTVYERYLRERSLYNKVEMAYRFHRRLMELRLDDHADMTGIGEFMVCLAFWALCMEGGWFVNGFAWIYSLRRRGMMQGTSEMFQYINRDESMHYNFWLDVLGVLIHEYPDAYTLDVQEEISETVMEATTLENTYAKDVCHNVIGISAESYMGQFRHFMNTNLGKIGLRPLFDRSHQPLDWLSAFQLSTEVNFFEGRVREYRRGGINWDEPRSSMNEVTDWNQRIGQEMPGD